MNDTTAVSKEELYLFVDVSFESVHNEEFGNFHRSAIQAVKQGNTIACHVSKTPQPCYQGLHRL
mgnify:FL=1